MTHKQASEELPLYKLVSSHEDLLAISRVLNESNLSTVAKEGVFKLVHSYGIEQRIDELRSLNTDGGNNVVSFASGKATRIPERIATLEAQRKEKES